MILSLWRCFCDGEYFYICGDAFVIENIYYDCMAFVNTTWNIINHTQILFN